jgi:hypothetical protein
MLSPSLVILSEAKNLRSSLRVNSAKHLCSSSQLAERTATAEILRCAQDDKPAIFSHLQRAAFLTEQTRGFFPFQKAGSRG